jgi:hypothetical protein
MDSTMGALGKAGAYGRHSVQLSHLANSGAILAEEPIVEQNRLREAGLLSKAERKRRPTPSSDNGTGGATGLAGGSGNRKKLYAMLGEEEGKKLGCQSLNPYWVEWLMGYPLSWTALED